MTFGSIALPLLGGALIGTSASLLLYTHGRCAGISGILGGAVSTGEKGTAAGNRSWRIAFLAGLVVSGFVAARIHPEDFAGSGASLGVLALAGVLAGFGARTSGGCTSGHGVCGLGSLSLRSLVATLTFMVVAAGVVFATRHVASGVP